MFEEELADDIKKVALYDEQNESITYEQLYRESNRLCEYIPKRSLVFSLCSNTIGSVMGYVGFLRNHIVPLLLSSHMDRELLKELLNNYEPAYIWYPSELELKSNEFGIKQVIYQAYGYSLGLLEEKEKTNMKIYDELALLLTTSGSTGSPKLVRQSYQSIEVNTKQIIEYLQLNAEEKPVTVLPMNYTYGLSVINTHLSVGATVCLTDKSIMQREFWQFFREQKCTSFSGVPYTYEILDKLRFYRMELPYLKTLTQAGGKLNPELHKKYAEYARNQGKNFIVMYGQCEATARMAYLPPEYALEKQGAMGIPVPGGEFTLLDDEGAVIEEPNTPGELVFRGGNVTLGYAQTREDLQKEDEFLGVLKTGDIAKKDEDGFYYIVGRKKRFLKIFGNRVNLDETERLIKGAYPAVECACCGMDDKMQIFINHDKFAEEIRSFVSEKTGLNSVAFQIRIVDEIPKNESGKILYKELEKSYGL